MKLVEQKGYSELRKMIEKSTFQPSYLSEQRNGELNFLREITLWWEILSVKGKVNSQCLQKR